MLLKYASTLVMLDGKTTTLFPIQRERQGYLLVFYFFLLIGEAFNMAANREQQLGKTQGILFLDSDLQQLVSN